MKYSLRDTSIVPAAISSINSRSQVNPFDKNGFLPLFTAPMSTVVSVENHKMFHKNGIYSIIPRNVELSIRKKMCTKTWVAFSLAEFNDMIRYCEFDKGFKSTILIDVANGHMDNLHNSIKMAKTLYGDYITIMAGNIANPDTYKLLSDAGADYIRVGIGGGSGCITASNTGIYYPMSSLISECYESSFTLNNPAYIVADGGIRGYSDAIKCLALGADYVMCGSVFNKMLESAGETICMDPNESNSDNIVDQYSQSVLESFKEGEAYSKTFYGMSTRKAQKELGNTVTKTSEGIERVNSVEYTISQWTDNFKDYLKSAMSYTDATTLHDFIGIPKTIIISNDSSNSINK